MRGDKLGVLGNKSGVRRDDWERGVTDCHAGFLSLSLSILQLVTPHSRPVTSSLQPFASHSQSVTSCLQSVTPRSRLSRRTPSLSRRTPNLSRHTPNLSPRTCCGVNFNFLPNEYREPQQTITLPINPPRL